MTNYWEGKRIRLRAVDAADAEAHHRFNQTEDYGLLDQIFPPGSLARVEEWATNQAKQGFEHNAYAFQMEVIETGELAGGIATHDADPRVGTFSYGIGVMAEHRGRGYAREAICLVLRYYFQERRFQKANVRVYDINEPSRRLHESLGFQLEGRIRNSVFTAGQFSDLLWYGITADEFRTRHSDYWR